MNHDLQQFDDEFNDPQLLRVPAPYHAKDRLLANPGPMMADSGETRIYTGPESFFDQTMNHVLAVEGGWSNHPADSGGCTMRGITLETYRSFMSNKKLTCNDLKAIPDDVVRAIYRQKYWDRAGLGLLGNYDQQLVIMDQAVNRGVSKAVIQAQVVASTIAKVRLTADGVIGPVSAGVIQSINPKLFAREYLQMSRHAYNDICIRNNSQLAFLQGWHNRVDTLEDLVWNIADVQITPSPIAKPVETDVKGAGKQPWMDWAEGELRKDIREIAGPKHNARIIYYHSFTSLKATADEVPWCGAFVSADLAVNGYKSQRSARAKDGLKLPNECDPFTPGAVVIMTRNGGGHIGFSKGKAKSGRILILGGNQGNRVSVAEYDPRRILGARMPVRA